MNLGIADNWFNQKIIKHETQEVLALSAMEWATLAYLYTRVAGVQLAISSFSVSSHHDKIVWQQHGDIPRFPLKLFFGFMLYALFWSVPSSSQTTMPWVGSHAEFDDNVHNSPPNNTKPLPRAALFNNLCIYEAVIVEKRLEFETLKMHYLEDFWIFLLDIFPYG